MLHFGCGVDLKLDNGKLIHPARGGVVGHACTDKVADSVMSMFPDGISRVRCAA